MNKISEITRRDILDIIKEGFCIQYEQPFFDGDIGEYVTEDKIHMPFYGRLDEIEFFCRLYDLEELPSYDSRYENALGDISCHLRWGDYEDYWFFQDERFKLRKDDGDEFLLRFICEMLHPTVRIENSPWQLYLEKFNELLRVDGYEIYAERKVSGRDIYGVSEYILIEKPIFPSSLFSVRYKDYICGGNGKYKDDISGNVEFCAKRHLCSIMFEFAEPIRKQRSRYDNWTDNTDALAEAIDRLNSFLEFNLIDLDDSSFLPCAPKDYLASQFTPYLFDIIEFQFDEMSDGEKEKFREAINGSLQKDSVPFELSKRGLIERDNDFEVLTEEVSKNVKEVPEPGIRDLIDDAITRYKCPDEQSHRDAVEKIWDAFERIKTFYLGMDKKTSVEKIIHGISGGQEPFIKLFSDEFRALTDIGNDYRIRHHEMNRIDIVDVRHYDYFFNRCLALVKTVLGYLEEKDKEVL